MTEQAGVAARKVAAEPDRRAKRAGAVATFDGQNLGDRARLGRRRGRRVPGEGGAGQEGALRVVHAGDRRAEDLLEGKLAAMIGMKTRAEIGETAGCGRQGGFASAKDRRQSP